MSNLIGPNQTVSRGQYGRYVRDALNIPEEFIAAHAVRIDLAYTMGEPIAMLADELKFRFEHRRRHTPTKSARSLAVRVVTL